jgi:hypothetical protein
MTPAQYFIGAIQAKFIADATNLIKSLPWTGQASIFIFKTEEDAYKKMTEIYDLKKLYDSQPDMINECKCNFWEGTELHGNKIVLFRNLEARKNFRSVLFDETQTLIDLINKDLINE